MSDPWLNKRQMSGECPICKSPVPSYRSNLGLCPKHSRHFNGKNWLRRKKGIPERTPSEYVAAFQPKRTLDPVATREKCRLRAKARYWKDPAHAAEIARKSRERHPERSREYTRQYNKSHPEWAKQWRIFKGINRGHHGACTIEQWMNRVSFYGWRCAYCKKTLNDSTLTVDHRIPISKNGPNWPSNLVPCCKPCNSKKRDKKWFR